jgi:hypothetical protein
MILFITTAVKTSNPTYSLVVGNRPIAYILEEEEENEVIHIYPIICCLIFAKPRTGPYVEAVQ